MTTVDLLSLASQPTSPFETIPIIDISGLSGDADAKAQVASAIREACVHVGFFYVKNHGVDETLITSAVDAARQFFDLPLEEKMKLDFHQNPNYRGYYPIATTPKKNCVLESFEIGSGIDLTNVSNSSLSGPNLWPPENVAPGLQEIVLQYYQEVFGLGLKLLSAFALALNLPEDSFADRVQTSPATMRLNHYPPQAEVADNADSGIGAHTDFQCFTILWQDEVPALQVRNSLGQWVDAKPIPGTFVVNIGNLLARWTNDIFQSTLHRAINRSGVRRYSIPLFFGTDHDVVIEVLSSCVSESRPARYEPIIAGDHIRSRFDKAYAYLK